MNRETYLLPVILALLFTYGCTKEKYEKLHGRWEKIDVADIGATHYTEWEFNNPVLTISYVSRSDPNQRIIITSGNYELKPGVLGTRLYISNVAGLYNGEWDIIELRKDRFSIKIEVDGGVLYYEFIKIN